MSIVFKDKTSLSYSLQLLLFTIVNTFTKLLDISLESINSDVKHILIYNKKERRSLSRFQDN